ncbi:MAG: acyl-CoA dehydrogenase family protein [Oligoflexia bacterium]|nr:acyl-CoA dehydrogenase family protein [Oligoflexia bacterium]
MNEQGYNFTESEEILALRTSVRRFAKERILPLARELDESETFSLELTKEMGEMGFFGVLIPPEYGGQGLDYLSYIAIVEELARIDSSQAAVVAVNNTLGAGSIYYFGTEEQKQNFLPGLCTGEGLWSFALTEADSGSDARSCKTTAVYDSTTKEWVINGSKIWISFSSTKISKGITLQAVTGQTADKQPELSCFLVPINTPGLAVKSMKGKMMWRATDTGELYFQNMRLPAKSLLGEKGEGFNIMMKMLDRGRLSIGAIGLGLAQGAFDLALEYAQYREAFGKKLCEHQAITFKLSEMATKIEAARNLLYKATWLRQNSLPSEKEAAMAKLFCSEVAEFCAREGQQIFGAYGLIKEYPIERFYRDAALLRVGEGTSEILKMVIGKHICNA